MRKSNFSDSQIMNALKQAEGGTAVPAICRELGISSATFYKWRSKYGGTGSSMIARLKELELENARLKKMNAEEKLKAEIVKEALGKSGEANATTGAGDSLNHPGSMTRGPWTSCTTSWKMDAASGCSTSMTTTTVKLGH